MKPVQPDVVRAKLSIYIELYRRRDSIELTQQLAKTNAVLRKRTEQLEAANLELQNLNEQMSGDLEAAHDKVEKLMGWGTASVVTAQVTGVGPLVFVQKRSMIFCSKIMPAA